MDLRRAILVTVAGVLVFAVVGVGLTELLAPYVWPSALVALPVAVVAGFLAVVLAAVGLRYRAERRTGSVSRTTRLLVVGSMAGTAGVILGTAAGLAVGSALAMPYFTGFVLVGAPTGLLVGVVAAVLAVLTAGEWRRGDPA